MYEIVVVLHLIFLLWVILGGLLVLWKNALIFLHFPAVVWGVLVEWNQWICPLTYLENDLRQQRGIEQIQTSFVDHYLIPIIYPPGLTANHQAILAVVLFLSTSVIYYLVFRRWRARKL